MTKDGYKMKVTFTEVDYFGEAEQTTTKPIWRLLQVPGMKKNNHEKETEHVCQ
jgi:hypothetical protein